MRQIRESLHLQAKLSYNEVGRTLKISKSVVGKYMALARVAGVDWNVAQALSDEELQAKLYKAALPRNSKQQLPDFANVHQELKRVGVTLQLLWEEYAKDNGPVGLGLLRAAPAVGALAMSLLLMRWPLRRRVGHRLLMAVAVFGLATVVFGVSNQLGEFESGATAALLGPVGSVVAGGLGTLIVAASWLRLFPALARRDRMI